MQVIGKVHPLRAGAWKRNYGPDRHARIPPERSVWRGIMPASLVNPPLMAVDDDLLVEPLQPTFHATFYCWGSRPWLDSPSKEVAMSCPENGVNQRKSFRCPVPNSRREAELRVRRRRLPVRLFNESSGGFAAWANRDPGVKVDEVAQLFTAVGRFEVRVAHVAQLAPAEVGQHGAEPLFRIGLERLRELNKPAEVPHWHSGRLEGLCSSRLVMLLVGVAFTLVLAAAAMGAVHILHRLNTPQFAGWGDRGASLWQSHGAAECEPRCLTETVQQLGLTRWQQKQIHQITEMTAHALQQFDAQLKDDDPDLRTRKQAMVLEAARAEVLNMLTDEQRARWESLFEQLP